MDLRWILRKLQYLFSNPKYFYLYFYGRPEKVLNALTNEPERHFFNMKKELDSDSGFIEALREKTQRIINKDFNLNIDHYFLYSLVRTIKPSVILETGVFHGHYTACMLKGVYDNYTDSSIEGKVISIDLPAYECISESTSETDSVCLPPSCEPGWVIPENLKERWRLLVGDSRDLLPEVLSDEKNISLFFHDSLHTYSHMIYEFETVFPYIDQGSYLMSHDIHWNRAFRHFVKKYNQKELGFHGFGIFQKK